MFTLILASIDVVSMVISVVPAMLNALSKPTSVGNEIHNHAQIRILFVREISPTTHTQQQIACREISVSETL